jgi:hypothetical protein
MNQSFVDGDDDDDKGECRTGGYEGTEQSNRLGEEKNRIGVN